MHVRADMVSRERAVMGLESRAVSARVTKNFVTILVKRVINGVISLPDATSYDKCKFAISSYYTCWIVC